jgi:P27 family predicted phage terminase small subunit
MPGLVKRRILTKEDMGQIENYCMQMGQVRQMQRTIDGLGEPFVYSRDGAARPHPAFRMQREAMGTARQIAAEYGLTPVSRSRPAMAPEGDSEDDWAGLVDE